jgi:hypothetical protein
LDANPPALTVAGARHEAFESKLTPKPAQQQQAPDTAAAATAAAAAAGDRLTAGKALLEDTLVRLAAANEDVATAEEHVNGLATLLQVCQGGAGMCLCSGFGLL